MAYWLVKTEPEVYSFDQLKKDQRTHWNGVRNHQAKKFLEQMNKGDFVFVYHSQGPREVVGIARVVKQAYPDHLIQPDDPKGHWVMVDLEYFKTLSKPVALSLVKSTAELSDMALVRQSRLSVMPVTDHQAKILLKLSETTMGDHE